MKVRISLMFKIMLMCVLIVLISAVSIRFMAYRTAENTLNSTLGQMALNITDSVVKTIDTASLAELVEKKDSNLPYYSQMKEELNNIRETLGLRFLYTMAMNADGSCYYIVDGMPLGSEEESQLGDVEEDISDSMKKALNGEQGYEFSESDVWGTLVSGYIPIKDSSGKVIGIIGADYDAEFMVDKLAVANRQMVLLTVVIVVLGSVLAMFFSRMIVKSIKQLQDKVELIKTGDLTIEVKMPQRDEVGSLSEAFQEMVDHMSEMIHGIRNNSDHIGQGIVSLNDSIGVSNKATEEITKIVDEIAQGAVRQTEGAQAAESAMKNVFSEIKTITGNIAVVNQDSDQAIQDLQEASEKLSGSTDQINLVNGTVVTTSAMMKQLEDKFQEVLSFSNSIEAIASKTNLLALNASIEAASAGEHGRGFAVVADEIKKLALQSGIASKRIHELILAVSQEIAKSSTSIEESVTQAKDSVNAMAEVDEYLQKLGDTNKKIDNRIKEIAAAIQNIEEDSRQVLDRTTSLSDIAKELSEGTQRTAAETQEQYAIMEEIKNDLIAVKEKAEQLKGTVNQFTIQ